MDVELLKKYLKDPERAGTLDDRAREELEDQASKDQDRQTLTQIRDGMGWPAVDISRHELEILDRVVRDVPVRTYVKKADRDKTLPVIFYLHGGGFFGGSIHNVEQICRTFADRGELRVVSVGYRLSPENPYPAGILDCWNVLETYAVNAEAYRADPDRFFVSGDSAGGNLTIALALLDHVVFGTDYVARILPYYPVIDLTTDGRGELWDTSRFYFADPSDQDLVVDYIKNFASQEPKTDEMYGGAADRTNILISPLLASAEELAALPPMKIIIGEMDPLRLQNDALIEKMQAAGLPVEYSVYNGCVHAFMDKIGDYPQAEEGVLEALDFFFY